MNIRDRVLLAIGSVLLALNGVTYIAFRAIQIQQAQGLEQQNTVQEVERVLNAIQQEISQLEFTVGDYAAWDDTYEFVEFVVNPTSTYIENNLSTANVGFVAIAIFNRDRDLVWPRFLYPDTQQEIPQPDRFQSLFAADLPLFAHAQPESSFGGLALSSTVLVLIGLEFLIGSE